MRSDFCAHIEKTPMAINGRQTALRDRDTTAFRLRFLSCMKSADKGVLSFHGKVE